MEHRCGAPVVLESAVWPILRDMPDFDELLKGSRDAMKNLFKSTP